MVQFAVTVKNHTYFYYQELASDEEAMSAVKNEWRVERRIFEDGDGNIFYGEEKDTIKSYTQKNRKWIVYYLILGAISAITSIIFVILSKQKIKLFINFRIKEYDCKEKCEEKQVEKNDFDFQQLNDINDVENPFVEKQIRDTLEEFYNGYVNINKRTSIKYWKKFFDSKQLKSLQKDIRFTKLFFKQMLQYNEFTVKVWDMVLNSVLKEWSYHYAGSETEFLILNCSKIVEQNIKQDIAKDKPKKQRKIGIIIDIIIITLFLLLSGEMNFGKAKIDKTDLEFANEYMEDMAFDIVNDIEHDVTEFDGTKEAYITYQINRKDYTDLNIRYNKYGKNKLRSYLAKLSWEIEYQK